MGYQAMSNEERINEIEIMLVHQERKIDELSEVVEKQWGEIDGLKSKLRMAEGKIEELQLGADGDAPAADQRPPHY